MYLINMNLFTLIFFATLLQNRVKTEQINITAPRSTDVNSLFENSTQSLFALQIRQIRTTSEATPPASSGNNLNVFATSLHENHSENFQQTSTIHLLENKQDTNKIRNSKENIKLRSSLDENKTKVKHKNLNIFKNEKEKALPSVWDGCLETYYKDQENFENLRKPSNNDEIKDIQQSNNIWTKRNTNESNAVANWIEKYNTLLRAKTEERRQQKQDLYILKKVTEPIKEVVQSTVQIVPITREVFEKVTPSLNVTQDTVTEPNTIWGYTEDWVETKEETKIRFSGLPHTENYLVPTLKIEEGFYPFSFMSNFFLLVYPSESSVGLIKDIVWGKFNFPYSFLQSIKVESTFLGFIVVFYCIALVIPSYLIILGILTLLSRSSCDDEIETGALFHETEDSECNDRVTAVITLLILLMCFVFVSGMAVNNEQAYAATEISRNVIRCACSDLASWLASAAKDLHYSIVSPVDLVVQAYKDDLRNVEELLGEPIQKAIASESGIDLVLDSLTDIITETEDLSSKISSLRDLSVRAGALATSTSDRIRDISRQIENLKKYCTLKDAPLCDTINTNSMEMQIRFDLILHEQQLLELRALGVENLTRAISTAKQEFRTLPSAITSQTTQVRAEILKDLETRRQQVHSSSRVLTDIVRHLTSSLQTASRRVDGALERFQTYDFWRWVAMLVCVATFGFILLLMLLAICCGCGKAKIHAKRTLQCSVVCLGFLCLLLWTMVSGTFLIAGHAEIYICSALWDSPKYGTLSSLLDKPSPIFSDDQGVFDILLQDLENITIDVPVRDVLRDCEKDQPAYVVFQLDKVIDVNKETSYFEWGELQNDLNRLTASIDVGLLKTVSAYFNKLLNQILSVSDVNLAKYRMEYGGAIVGKDLPALSDQLENIAAQVTDLTTAGRLEALATRTKRVYATNIKPLEQLRAEVVFKLTELELQLQPFRKKLNISLSHIHTAQYYIDNQGDVIARKKISVYITRLLSHTAGWRTHVLTSTGLQAARCRPLFTVYSALRTLLCSRYLSSLHGWWVCGFFLGIVWCTTLTPICVRLWQAYGEKNRLQESMLLSNMNSCQQETPTTAMCEGSNWHTPGPPPPPPRSDSW